MTRKKRKGIIIRDVSVLERRKKKRKKKKWQVWRLVYNAPTKLINLRCCYTELIYHKVAIFWWLIPFLLCVYILFFKKFWQFILVKEPQIKKDTVVTSFYYQFGIFPGSNQVAMDTFKKGNSKHKIVACLGNWQPFFNAPTVWLFIWHPCKRPSLTK